LEGSTDAWLYSILDTIDPLKVAFVGSGPYPVSALLLRQRYPTAAITCIDNHIAAHILSSAVIEKLNLNITTRFEEAIDVDYSPFNAVVVAAMVSHRTQLLRKVLKTSEGVAIVRGKVAFQHDRLYQRASGYSDSGAAEGS
jgi:hypothetical protein